MRFFSLILLTCLLSYVGCGANSLFSEGYWNDGRHDNGTTREESQDGTFVATLLPLVSVLSNVGGNASLNLTGLSTALNIQMTNLPSSMVIAHHSITSLSCATVASNARTIDVGSVDGKTASVQEIGSRDALIAQINLSENTHDTFVNLDGKRLVVNAMVIPVPSPIPQTASIVPIACGDIQRETTPSAPTGVTAGGVVGGTTGDTTVGSVGGSIAGSVGGPGGTTGGIVGGSIGGTPNDVSGIQAGGF